jgi:hypothetical protein
VYGGELGLRCAGPPRLTPWAGDLVLPLPPLPLAATGHQERPLFPSRPVPVLRHESDGAAVHGEALALGMFQDEPRFRRGAFQPVAAAALVVLPLKTARCGETAVGGSVRKGGPLPPFRCDRHQAPVIGGVRYFKTPQVVRGRRHG